jgi:hypothetical protein
MVLAFIKLLFCNDDYEKSLQKIIGGLAVFVVAIISKNGWVFSVSLFIGGLIIASEEFMQKLAIIFNSKSEDIGRNLTTEPATRSEIEEKQKNESSEITKHEGEKEDTEIEKRKDEKEKNKKQFIDNINKVKIVENKALGFLSKNYGNSFQAERKMGTKRGTLIADGVICDSVKNIIYKIVEIKYVRPENSIMSSVLIIRRTLERIKFLIDLPVLIVLVSETMTKDEAITISNRIKQFGDVELKVLNISKDGDKIELIY